MVDFSGSSRQSAVMARERAKTMWKRTGERDGLDRIRGKGPRSYGVVKY